MKEMIKEIEAKMARKERAEKFSIDLDYLTAGERRHLYELMYAHGPGNGKMMFLPIDQGLEHGPRDFFPNPPSADLVKNAAGKFMSAQSFVDTLVYQPVIIDGGNPTGSANQSERFHL